MKRFLTLIALSAAAFLQPAHAATLQPYLDPVRSEITNQLTIASNTVPVDKKLITSLKSALSKLNKPGTASLVGDTKLLSTLAPAFNKTSLSNNFYLLFNGAADNYLALLLANAGSSSNALGATYPSGSRTAAQKKLDALFVSLVNAGNALDLKTITKLLSSASTALVITDKLIDKAESVPPPPSSCTARVTGAVTHSFKDTQVGVSSYGGGNFFVICQQVITRPFGQRIITLGFSGLVEGNNTLSFAGPGADADYVYSQLPLSGESFRAQTGTVQVNYNSAAKILSGTFTFTGEGQENPASATVTGSFVFRY